MAVFLGGWRRSGALIAAGLCLLGAVGAAGQGRAGASLSWEPSPSPTTVGYKVYYGTTSLTYTHKQPVENMTAANLFGLLPGTTYYFAVTAVDDAGKESTFSNEVAYTVPGAIVSNGPPVVTLASPINGEIYLSPAILNLAANVISNGHTINAIEYFNGPTYLGTAVQPPYSLTWTDATPGTCTLNLQAVYDSNSSVGSPAVTIAVVEPASPWLSSDIGSPEAPGGAGQLNGCYLVSGAGTIGGVSDSFQFACQPMSGDVSLTAYVSSVQDTNSNGLAGIMIRESLAGGAQYAAVGLTPDGRVVWSARTNTGSLALSDTWEGGSLAPLDKSGTSPAAWLCLRLVGNNFYGDSIYGFYSTNGVSWSEVGATRSNMGSSTYAGLAVSSGLPNVLNTACFINVNLGP